MKIEHLEDVEKLVRTYRKLRRDREALLRIISEDQLAVQCEIVVACGPVDFATSVKPDHKIYALLYSSLTKTIHATGRRLIELGVELALHDAPALHIEHSPYVDIARVCHEVNLAYCAAIGDHSQVPWDAAPLWQRESAIKGVQFAIENPDAGPDAQHNAWLKEKTEQGWTYGPVKDPENKKHPCVLPYGQLPLAQKVKDFLFLAVVRAMA